MLLVAPAGYELVDTHPFWVSGTGQWAPSILIGERWLWSYAGGSEWLPTRHAGEAPPKNNIYARPIKETA